MKVIVNLSLVINVIINTRNVIYHSNILESPQLLKLHEEFIEMLKEYRIEIVSFAEAKPTLVTALKFSFQFVSLDSAGNALGQIRHMLLIFCFHMIIHQLTLMVCICYKSNLSISLYINKTHAIHKYTCI